jgi:hypothetical protein
MKDGRHAELSTEALLVLAELEQCAGRGREQEGEDRLAVPERERDELVGHREHDVEVVRGEHVLHPFIDPRGLGKGLAFRTVAISARVVGGPGERARVADVDMAAEELGPADLDRAHGGPLLGQDHVRLAIALAVGAEDVRDLETWPPPLLDGAGPCPCGAIAGYLRTSPSFVPMRSSGLLVLPMCRSDTLVYRAVVWIDEWPSNRWMTRMSMPISRRWVAKL